MRTCIKQKFLLSALIAGLGLVGPVRSQTFTILYNFAGGNGGFVPNGRLILSGKTFYGTTRYGGSAVNEGEVFAVNTDGGSFRVVYAFSGYGDGAHPNGVILSGDTLYGTTELGGDYGGGAVFSVNTNGSGFLTLHSFSTLNSDGAEPYGELVISGNTLYGTARIGPDTGPTNIGNGTVFALKTDGSGFTVLHRFAGSDGSQPRAGLFLSGGNLYGTTFFGGTSGNGTVFSVNVNGTGFTNLYSFTGTPYHTNSDGSSPSGGLVLSPNTLYGTTQQGGSSGKGTVFALNTDGTGFRVLHSFTSVSGQNLGTNSDGATPHAGLVLSGNTLYGMAYYGGAWGIGTVFCVNTYGTTFRTLHDFELVEGGLPEGDLIMVADTLYGTTSNYGHGNGMVFALVVPPQLTMIPSGPNVILAWPTNYAGFDYTGYTLQSTTNLGPSAVWTTNLPSPVVINGQNTVTNPISGTWQFFRLSQ